MTNEALKRKEEFIRRRKGMRSEADMMAQQLTNIYRQLSVLGDDATAAFNQQLIRDVNPDVLASLKTVPGGEELRSYYDFLTHTETDEDELSYLKNEGAVNNLLPKPEQMSPIWESFGMSGSVAGKQKPIQMAVVNPIRASVITSGNSGSGIGGNGTAARPQQSNVDFVALQNDLTQTYEKQRQAIMQALNFIVIDSNIEKMHQNLKNAIQGVDSNLNALKDDLMSVLRDVREKAAFPAVSEAEPAVKQEENKKSPTRFNEKFKRPKSGQKFSVDITEEIDE